MLGRGRSGRSLLLLALVVVPMAALFLVGSLKRDLFELRYFSGAVPAMLLLGARVVTATTVRRGADCASHGRCADRADGRRARRPADQRRQPPPVRLRGRVRRDHRRGAGPGDVVLYEPSYLAEVVDYYAPGVDAAAGRLGDPGRAPVWVAGDRPRRRRRGHLGPARHRARRARAAADASSSRSSARTSGSGSCDDRVDDASDDPPSADRQPVGAGVVGRRRAQRAPRAGHRAGGRRARSRSSLYFWWLLRPGRIGNPVLFGVLLVAELFNVVQALGFWWTCLSRRRRHRAAADASVAVDASTSPPSTCSSRRTASRSRSSRRPSPRRCAMRGAHVRVALLDDGNRDEMERLAAAPRRAVRPPHAARGRQGRQHQPRPRAHRRPVRARARLRPRAPPRLAGAHAARVRRPSRSPTCRRRSTTPTPAPAGSPAPRGASRRCSSGRSPAARTPTARCSAAAPTSCSGGGRSRTVGGFPEGSLTEDFELSVGLHERGWRVGVRPGGARQRARARRTSRRTSASSTAGRGAASARSRACCGPRCRCGRKAAVPAVGVVLPVRLDRARVPVAAGRSGSSPAPSRSPAPPPTASSPRSRRTSPCRWRRWPASAAGRYTFAAYSLATSTFWIHVHATCASAAAQARQLRRDAEARRVRAASGGRPRRRSPSIGVLVAAAVVGLARGRDAATLNNVAFAALHVVGAVPRRRRGRRPGARRHAVGRRRRQAGEAGRLRIVGPDGPSSHGRRAE